MISLPFRLLLMKLPCHERGEEYVGKLLDRASVCFVRQAPTSPLEEHLLEGAEML